MNVSENENPKTLEELITMAESLRGAALLRLSPEAIERKVRAVASSAPVIGTQQKQRSIWYRGRICETAEGWDNIRECIYHQRPNEIHHYGRANYPHEAVFYASWNLFTVLSELQPRPGQFVQIIGARTQKGRALMSHAIGEYTHVFNSGTSQINEPTLAHAINTEIGAQPTELVYKSLYFDAFMAEQFSQRTKKPHEHMLTAAYARLMFSTNAAVIYPSVESPAAMNIAVPTSIFDQDFEVLFTEVFLVKSYCGYSLWQLERTKATCEFHEDMAVWDSTKTLPRSHGAIGDVIYSADIVGWCVLPHSGAGSSGGPVA